MSQRSELRSGLWAGHYVQHDREFPQQMRLEFADGLWGPRVDPDYSRSR